ncbi:unnamed protein product [Spirodela intermedia]|uniref:Uncharacterized protein n=1 Tax=Spirodela intermedia TaxID=51605 RepID=A0A7I8JUE2_SPIIN|nr:unnamed protein product [Spirodela intermedia]CAA6673375.1 unnamed protein product [Spirodela intermedia]
MQGEGEKKGHAVVVRTLCKGTLSRRPSRHQAGRPPAHLHSPPHRRRRGDDDDIFDRRAAGLDIRYELVSDGLPADFDRSSNHDQFMLTLLHVSSAHVESLLRRISCRHPPPTCLIADTFFVWPAALSSKFGLLHASFWTEPALVFSLYYHLDLLRYHGHFASPGNTTMGSDIIFRAFEGAKAADLLRLGPDAATSPWPGRMPPVLAAVLSDAVGGFLSHCGWNSVLESIWCGVPLLCFPLLTDQFTNRKLVVDEWRIGLEEEVARKIGLLMGGGAARDSLDAAMKEARGALAGAGGSSRRNLDQFILDLKAR